MFHSLDEVFVFSCLEGVGIFYSDMELALSMPIPVAVAPKIAFSCVAFLSSLLSFQLNRT